MFGRVPKSRHRQFRFLHLVRLEERDTPSTYSPSQMLNAYGFNQVPTVKGTTLTGAGETIAIVDAYYDPNAQSDLNAFDADFGLPPPPSFQQIGQAAGSNPSTYNQNSSWAGETTLDIEWAHAIAPGAKILLVEAKSQNSNGANLYTAAAYAASQPNVAVVSMSWGYPEFSSETTSTYTNDFSSTSVSFVAAAGDNGAGTIFPSVSPTVLSVGGTTLNLSGSTYSSETVWNNSIGATGGGPSTYVSRPTFQNGDLSVVGGQRGTPDVAYDADPNTGVYVYDTSEGGLVSGVGGTSAGTPQWAALIALADQGRSLLGLSNLGASQLMSAIYSFPETDYHDITSGNNDGYSAANGYDMATGLGSPKAQYIIPALYSYGATAPAVTTQPTSMTVNAGTSVTFTAAASGNPTPSVQWQISTNDGVNFTNISGATSPSYTIAATASGLSGDEYRAIFTNGIGTSVATTAATLTVDFAPVVSAQPASVSVTVGQTAFFNATAGANPTSTVQWQVSTDGTTFNNISGATAATYSFTPALTDNGSEFRAAYTNSVGTTYSNAATLTVDAPMTVASVQVNDGSAQRSEVWSLTVTFSGPVTFAGGNANAAAAFQLLHIQTGNDVILAAAVSTNAQGATVVVLTFSGSETDPVSTENGGTASLADGRYQLTILSADVADANGAALDGEGVGTSGNNYVSPADTAGGGAGQLHLFRLFGDVNGDGVVDSQDLGQFRAAYNAAAGNPMYLAYLDSDNSGVVDSQDLGQFRSRYNASVF